MGKHVADHWKVQRLEIYHSPDILNLLGSLELSKNLDEDDKNNIFRLRDLLIRSVHLVDRGANKTRFLVTKRGEMHQTGYAQDFGAGLGPELIKNDDSTLSAVTTQKSVSLPKSAKEGMLQVLAEGMERAATLQSAIKSASESDDATVPAELIKEAQAVGGLFGSFAQKFQAKVDASDEEKDDEETEKAEHEEDEEDEEDKEMADDELKKLDDGSISIGGEIFKGALASFAESVVKEAGGKISGDHIKALKGIMTNMRTLLGDLSPEVSLKQVSDSIAKREDGTHVLLTKQAKEIESLKDMVANMAPRQAATIAAGSSGAPGDSSTTQKREEGSPDFLYNADMFPEG